MSPKYGHTRRPAKYIEHCVTQPGKDIWRLNGQERRFSQIYHKDLDYQPLNHIAKLGVDKPKIMILGPGKGRDILELNGSLAKIGLKPEIDVFGLKKTIDEDVAKIVKNDYSANIALESIDPENEEHKKLIDAMKGKYHLVMAPSSATYFTNHVAYNLFSAALMLSKGGMAFLEIDFANPKVAKNLNNVDVAFKKHVQIYNNIHGTKLEFGFAPYGKLTEENHGKYILIMRNK